jgi:type I restriction enzyme S subunit
MRVDPKDLPLTRNPYLKENEIIVVRSGAYTGDSAIIPAQYAGSVAGYDMVMTVNRASPRFVSYCLLSDYVLKGQLFLLTLRAAQPHLNAEELGSVMIALPPTLEEQNKIVEFLDTKLNELEATVFNIEQQISTLTEYRKSLIHECVTGKRKVI